MARPRQPSTHKTNCWAEDLQKNERLWHKILVFLYDLRHFSERDDSRSRLELVIDASYISAPYFEPAEVRTLKSMVINDSGQKLEQLIQETLDEKLSRRKRVESADYRVCAAHDLAPVFERVFGVKPKDLQKDKKFVKTLSTNGLDLKKDVALPGTATKNLAGKKDKTGTHLGSPQK